MHKDLFTAETLLQEHCHILAMTRKCLSSYGLQRLAFLPPQHHIQVLQDEPQIYAFNPKMTINWKGVLVHKDMVGRSASAARALPQSIHYPRGSQKLWVAMGGIPSTSTWHVPRQSWA